MLIIYFAEYFSILFIYLLILDNPVNCCDDLNEIITPVNVDIFEQLLKQTNYDSLEMEFVINGFRYGFPLGYERSEIRQTQAKILRFRCGSEKVLWDKMMKEVKLRRFPGPFTEIPFNNYIQSLVGLVPKNGGKDTRLIFHLSAPKGVSVNSNTPPEKFSVRYKDLDNAIRNQTPRQTVACHESEKSRGW